MSQLSFDAAPPPPSVPRPLVEFLAGVAARYAFGEKPTEQQKRDAMKAAEAMAVELAQLRPDV